MRGKNRSARAPRFFAFSGAGGAFFVARVFSMGGQSFAKIFRR